MFKAQMPSSSPVLGCDIFPLPLGSTLLADSSSLSPQLWCGCSQWGAPAGDQGKEGELDQYCPGYLPVRSTSGWLCLLYGGHVS